MAKLEVIYILAGCLKEVQKDLGAHKYDNQPIRLDNSNT